MRYIILFCFLFVSNLAFCSPTTYGHGLAGPNRFWANISPDSFAQTSSSTQIQMNTAANNPDVFCESQGDGYRLPGFGEFSHNGISTYRPGLPYNTIKSFHWFAYKNNDPSQAVKTNNASRSINSSLWNEWGNLKNYNSWNDLYWTTEIVNGNVCGYPSTCVNWGRLHVNLTNGTGPSMRASSQYRDGDAVRATNTRSVACVRDLIVTPSTPVPGKVS